MFNNLFGVGGTSTKKEEPKQANYDFKDDYNKKVGQASDKALDEAFKNQKFKKQS